jgi:hypothetical protein
MRDSEALAYSVNELLTSKDLRDTFTETAYRYVLKNHSNEFVSLQYDRLFKRLKK